LATKINKNKVIAAAQKFVQKGQYEKAIKEYEKIVEEDPRDVRIWLKIGDLHAKANAPKQAIDTYAKVAEFYSEQGFYLKAVAVYKQILKIDGALVEINLRLAELYKQLGLLSDAMQQYEQVSNFYHQAGRTKEALAALRQIVDLDPQNVASRIKLAELYSKEQMRDEAIAEFAKAADFLRAENRLDDFVKVAERLVFHQPDNLPVTKELAGIYLSRRDPRRALQKLQLAFKADPRDEETLEMLAQAFEDLGQVPKTVSVLKELAHIHSENGNEAKRNEIYTRILQLSPHDEEAQQVLSAKPEAAVRPERPAPVFDDAPEPAPGTAGYYGSEEAAAGFAPEQPAAGDFGDLGAQEDFGSFDRGYAPEHLEEEVSAAEFDDYGIEEEPVEVIEEIDVPSTAERKPVRRERPSREAAPLREPLSRARVAGTSAGPQIVAPIRAGGSGDLADEVAKILTEADVYIKYGLHEKAVDHLRQVFTRDPDNLEVHLKLKDLYLQLGRYAEAVRELLFLGHQQKASDRPQAAAYLNEALELDPDNREARSLLATLEGSSRGEPAVQDYSELDDGYADDGYGEVEPIDLEAEDIVEEIPIESSSPSVTHDRKRERFGGQGQYATEAGEPWTPDDGVDDYVVQGEQEDYGAEEEVVEGDEEQPREFDYPYSTPPSKQGSGIIELHGETTDTLGGGTPSSEVIPLGVDQPVSQAHARAHREEETSGVEDDLEEAEFFIQQNLYGEARAILEDLVARHPKNALLAGKLADLDAMEARSGTATVSEPAPGPGGDNASLAADLAAELDDLEPAEDPRDATDTGYSVEDVFEDIKHSVEHSQVADEDSDTHYDLGIAYREMGLMDDAISEFKIAMRSREKEVLCHMMIGLCYVEKGLTSEAISQFKTGLYVEGITDRETIALYFELGQAYERFEDAREALYYYEKVAKKDPRFRDVASRIERIRAQTGNGEGRHRGSDGGSEGNRGSGEDGEGEAAHSKI
jgi:tetratricopeptide (TPR) repeat protein